MNNYRKIKSITDIIKGFIEKIKTLENISVILVLSFVATMLVLYGIFKYIDYSNTIKIETRTKADYISELGSFILREPLWNYDMETIKSIVTALGNDEEIKELQLINVDNSIIYETSDSKKPHPGNKNNLIYAEAPLVKDGIDEVGNPIENQYIGSFRVGITNYYKEKNLVKEFVYSLFWVLVALIFASYSISEILRQEKNSKDRVSAILNNMADSVITIDENLIIKTCNLATEKVFGYKENELIDMNLKSLFKFDIKQDNKKFSIKELRTYVNKELFGIKNDKTEVPIEFNLGTINMNNENTYILVIRDITERYEVDRVKNEFVSIVSHELRTPLTSIKASLELALTGVLGTVPDKMREVITIAHGNSKRLNFLINDILDINKISQGKIDFDFKNLSLLPIIEETIEQNLDYAKQYNVGIEIKDNISGYIIVNTDKHRLMQILVNLISNAIKFSHNGGKVHIYVEERENSVIINVQDYGIGIPEKAQDKIFKKFSQVDSSSTRAKGGTGLGLYINKMLVDRMNGKISFVSEENKGSTFSVEVPKAS